MKKVIIAEKPSVARNIAEALKIKKRKNGYFEGEEYIITWAFGHLLQLFDAKDYNESMKSWKLEKFPFIPEHFEYKIKNDSNNRNQIDLGAEKQINLISSLINRSDVDGIISATDYDREGQVIADELFIYLKTEKNIERLLLNEWTPKEVEKGMGSLKNNNEMKPLQDAGIGRQWADWIIGINFTSVATIKYKFNGDKILNIGRVLLPTLKIIYDRDISIENFKVTSYYKMTSVFKTKNNSNYEGIYYENKTEKFENKKYLDEIKTKISGKAAYILDKFVENKKEYPPLLFNLSNLQGHITSKYKGWTSDKVLKVAQTLYEQKLITYPRTGSVALEESLKEKTQNVLNKHKIGLPFEEKIKFKDSKRIFDNSKVEGHSAIMPTYILPKHLSEDQKIVYSEIRKRFIIQFMPVAEYEETKIISKVRDDSVVGEFITRGKIQVKIGWKIADKKNTKDTMLPMLNKNDEVILDNSKVKKISKKPPKRHNEKSLLKTMETCGKNLKNNNKDYENANEEENQNDELMNEVLSGYSIGTPATRGEIIKKLRNIGYIKSNGKSLECTELGRKIVEQFPVKDLLDLDYTGKLEKTLLDIEKGLVRKKDFIDLITDFTKTGVAKIKNDNSYLKHIKIEVPKETEIIGICPECGNPVIEGERGFGCSNWKNGCKFIIWKDDKYINSFGKKVSKEMVALLLKNGKVGFRGLKSKKGNVFSAYFRYEKKEDSNYYKWKIEFID